MGKNNISITNGKTILVNGIEINAEDIVIIGTEKMPKDELQFVIRKNGWVLPINFDEAVRIVSVEKDCTEGGAKDWLFSDGVEYYDTLWDAAVATKI